MDTLYQHGGENQVITAVAKMRQLSLYKHNVVQTVNKVCAISFYYAKKRKGALKDLPGGTIKEVMQETPKGARSYCAYVTIIGKSIEFFKKKWYFLVNYSHIYCQMK